MNDRKIYYSFQEMPWSKSYGNTYGSTPQGLKFSKTEIIHLLIAMGVLTIAFGYVLAPSVDVILIYLAIAFIAIATAFICHEIAHKYMGQKYGYWSEFRMYPMGLLFALFFALFTGFIFAAPGAVRIYGNPDREQSGKISVAGPLTNIIIAIISIGVMIFTTGFIALLASFVAFINAFLAFFNLLPLGPLDGTKVFRWNKGIWISLIILSIGLLIPYFI